MKRPPKQQGRKGRGGTSYAKKAGAMTTTGHRQRLNENQIRATQLRIEGHCYEDIALIMMKEQGLPAPVSIRAVARWLADAAEAYEEDLNEIQVQYRDIQSNHYDRIIKRTGEAFFAPNLRIERRVMENGEMVNVLDENAAKELGALGKVMVSALSGQSKLWGLNIEKPSESSEDGPKSLQELHLWIINQSHQATPEKPAIDVQAEVLELETGLETDSL